MISNITHCHIERFGAVTWCTHSTLSGKPEQPFECFSASSFLEVSFNTGDNRDSKVPGTTRSCTKTVLPELQSASLQLDRDPRLGSMNIWEISKYHTSIYVTFMFYPKPTLNAKQRKRCAYLMDTDRSQKLAMSAPDEVWSSRDLEGSSAPLAEYLMPTALIFDVGVGTSWCCKSSSSA